MIILWLLKFGIAILIRNKDDIEFVNEFPCFFGTPCMILYAFSKLVFLVVGILEGSMILNYSRVGQNIKFRKNKGGLN